MGEKVVITTEDIAVVPVEVFAVASMAGEAKWSGRKKAALIEKAMSDAILECNAEGISTATPEGNAAIRERMMAARQAVLDSLGE